MGLKPRIVEISPDLFSMLCVIDKKKRSDGEKKLKIGIAVR